MARFALLSLTVSVLPKAVTARVLTGSQLLQFANVAILTPATARAGLLAIACPIACTKLGIEGRDFDPSLLSLIVATPSAFSINAAYQRRERALNSLAQFRSAAYMLDLAFQRWAQDDLRRDAKAELNSVYDNLVRMCTDAEASDKRAGEAAMLSQIDALGASIERMRRDPNGFSREGTEALATIFISDERLLVQAADQVRTIAFTQTPVLLRAFTVGGSAVFPILFAPYFAVTAEQPDRAAWAAYLVSFLFATTISSLVRIQEALEDPFDGDAVDDIDLTRFAPPPI